ncbi:MAG: hypothetical protein NZ932_04045 [Candidatus Bathyarchaeota archaeon]|nr:hypothetical protein [Candidatus Bathyarchaeota archaeon]MDW8022359.1 hypothetical protein [Nitrososphaerota archaeon]
MKEEEILEIVKGWGFKSAVAKPLTRLILYAHGAIDTLPEKEFKKWQRLGIIDENGYVVLSSDKTDIEWIMFGLAWQGYVQRVEKA